MNKGNGFSMYNRHSYLNTQILQFHQNVDKTLNKFNIAIKVSSMISSSSLYSIYLSFKILNKRSTLNIFVSFTSIKI